MMSILEMSFYGAVMILAAVVLRTVAVHRLPKRTFVALWWVVLARLLLPFTIPSPASIYTLAEKQAENLPIQLPVTLPAPNPGTVTVPGPVQGPLPTFTAPVVTPTVPTPAPAAPSIPVWTLVWLAGALVCGIFFAVVYLRNQREFRTALPADSELLSQWLAAHPLKRRVTICQSDRINAPLTYGLLRPVILLPADANLEDREALEYVLAHELTHIRRWDGLFKLALVAAVCVHWFNPLVWVMFFLANRDLELSCDEAVVRSFGETARGSYAKTLLRMEETKAGLTPIYNHFSKSALEERVVSIMKTRKRSLLAGAAAVVLVAVIAVVFATSPKEETQEPPANWLPTLEEEDIQEITWSARSSEALPLDKWNAARLINLAAQRPVDKADLPDGGHGLVFADLHVTLTDGRELYLNVGTVENILRISLGDQSGYFQEPLLYRWIAKQNDTPDNVDQDALARYGDAIRTFLISTMPESVWVDRVTIDENTDLPAGSVRGYTQTFKDEPVSFRQDLTQLYLLQTSEDLNAQVWVIESATTANPVEKIMEVMGNSYLDSQFRMHGAGAGYRLVTVGGIAQGFQTGEWSDRGGLDQYDSPEELKKDLIPLTADKIYGFDPNILTAEELRWFNEEFFNCMEGDSATLRNLFAAYLYNDYASPKDVNLFEIFYCGAQPSNPVRASEAELAALRDQGITVNEYDAPFYRVTRAEMDQVLSQYIGLTLAETNQVGLNDLPYLEEYDAYYWQHGDTNYPYGIRIVQGVREWDLVRLDQESGYGLRCTTLRLRPDGSYWFVSNLPVSQLPLDTLIPLENAVNGLALTWHQVGESLFLNDGAVEIELRAGEPYVYRRGYVTAVLPDPMELREGVPHLPISFCNQYLNQGGDLCHAVMFFRDEVQTALQNPTAEGSQRLLSAVSLPRSMGIEIFHPDPDRIFGEQTLDNYPEILAAELSAMGISDAKDRAYGEYEVLTRARSVTQAGLAKYFLQELPDEDPDLWTAGAYSDWQQAQLLEQRMDGLSEEERAFVEEHNIQPQDLIFLLREFYFDILSPSPEELRAYLENRYRTDLALLGIAGITEE